MRQPVIPETHFVPAFVQRDKTLHWWKEDSIFYYPYVLMSAHPGINIWNFREKYQIGEEVLFLGDSGGFSTITLGIDLDPLHVLRWQEKNCDVGFCLDYPPTKMTSKKKDARKKGVRAFSPLSFGETVKYLKKNAENARLAFDKRRTDMELIFCGHGRTEKELIEAYKQLKNVGLSPEDFDGLAISNKDNRPSTITTQLLFLLDRLPKGKRLHYFALTGRNILSLLYFAMYYRPDVKFTFDSAAYSRGAIGREYKFFGMKQSIQFSSKPERKTSLKILPCTCPVCRRFEPETLHGSTAFAGSIISLHNLYRYIEQSYILNSLKDDQEIFFEFARKFCKPDVLRCMKKIRDYFEERVEHRSLNGFFRKVERLRKWF